jgi:flagellar motor switch protein FliN/FliY
MAKKTKVQNRSRQVTVDVRLEMARLRVPIEKLLNYSEGTLIELDQVAGEPFDVRVNDVLFAKGEAISIGENMGIRFLEIYDQE